MQKMKVMDYRPGMIIEGKNMFIRPPATVDLSLRDYFAARAMQSIVTHKTYEFSKSSYEITAKTAYAIADAMIQGRECNVE